MNLLEPLRLPTSFLPAPKRSIGAKIHTTIGVYPNTHRKYWRINGVAEEHLLMHINHNKSWRPGRALFVDGVCVLRGSVLDEDIVRIEGELKRQPITRGEDTAPYR